MWAAIANGLKALAIILGWAKRNEEKKDDFAIASAADLTGIVKEHQGAQTIAENVDRLSDDELNRRLRASQSGS